MLEEVGAAVPRNESVLVPVELEGGRLYVDARAAPAHGRSGEEREIAAHRPSLDEVLDGVTALARRLSGQLASTGASKIAVEFGCEIALESGGLVAVLGKVNAKSAFKVGLEWTQSKE